MTNFDEACELLITRFEGEAVRLRQMAETYDGPADDDRLFFAEAHGFERAARAVRELRGEDVE